MRGCQQPLIFNFFEIHLIAVILNLASTLLEFLSVIIYDGRGRIACGILKIVNKVFKWNAVAKKQLEPRLVKRKDSD